MINIYFIYNIYLCLLIFMKIFNCVVVNMKFRRFNFVEEKGFFEKVLIIRENLFGDEDLVYFFRIVFGKKSCYLYE